MYIVWRDSLFYFSEYEHIVYLTDTVEKAIKFITDNNGTINTTTYEYIESGIEFEREYNDIYYISEIEFACKELFVLQFVKRDDNTVQLFFDDNKRELDIRYKNNVASKTDNEYYIQTKMHDIYEFSVKLI